VVLTKQFKVKEIGIFGSVVRGEDKETSDVDIENQKREVRR